MKRKEKSLKKLARVQSALHDLARWRHAAADFERRTLEQGRDELLKTLTDCGFAFGQLGEMAARSAQRAEVEIVGTEKRLTAASLEALRQGARAKIVSTALDDARRAVDDMNNRASLAEIAEAVCRSCKQA